MAIKDKEQIEVSLVKLVEGGESTTHSALEGVSMARLGLMLDEGLSYDRWYEIGESIARVAKAMPWIIGDWLNYGERNYGEMYSQALEITGLEYQTLANYKSVAAVFTIAHRRANLSFDHHAAAAALMRVHVDAAEEILDAAERDRISAKETRADVRRAQVDMGLRPENELVERERAQLDALTGEIMPNSAWLDDLLSIVLTMCDAASDEELMLARARAREWAREKGMR